jgi:hypothetical protein
LLDRKPTAGCAESKEDYAYREISFFDVTCREALSASTADTEYPHGDYTNRRGNR